VRASKGQCAWPSFETRAERAPHDDVLFFFQVFFFQVFFFQIFFFFPAACFFLAAIVAVLRAFGRFLTAARWAARQSSSGPTGQFLRIVEKPRWQLPIRVDRDGLRPGLVLKRFRPLGFELRNGLIVGTEIETGPQRHGEVDPVG
jgi:hypothetical protein